MFAIIAICCVGGIMAGIVGLFKFVEHNCPDLHMDAETPEDEDLKDYPFFSPPYIHGFDPFGPLPML